MELRFACTACGKCCTEPPEMTVLEAIALGDVFVPALVYRMTSVPRDDNEAALAALSPHPHFRGMDAREFVGKLREGTAVRAAGAFVSEPGWEHHVSISVRPWTYDPWKSPTGDETRGCPALAGRECSIHARRPHTCRTVPVRYDVPEGLLVRAFRGTVEAGLAASDAWECDVSDAAPVLLEDETIVDRAYASARAAGAESAMAERELAARIFQHPLMPPFNRVVAELRKNQLVSVSFHGALAAAHDHGLVDAAGVAKFCDQQLALLERELAAALARRRREDREVTARFRTLESAYRAMRARVA